MTGNRSKFRGACISCGAVQKFSRPEPAEDEGLKKMLAEGTIRACPKCGDLTMKEYGICNVIQCSQCGIWWNWQTKVTGTSSVDLKNKARQNGSLWGAGELAYQQNLERTDKEAFIGLLERSGIKYDPNYRRGT